MGFVKSNSLLTLHFFSSNELNLYYSNISSHLPLMTRAKLTEIISNTDPVGPSFSFSPITKDTVRKTIKDQASSSLSAGPDGTSKFVIRKALPS